MRQTRTWKVAFFKLVGVLMMAGGLWSIAWGVQRLDEPPIPSSSYRHATTEQIGAICMGGMTGLFGFLAYRHGRSRSDG